MKKIIYASILIVSFLISPLVISAGGASFVIKNIEVHGLKRTSLATVESYLVVKRGQTLSPSETAEVMRALYKTSFFEKISLSREGNTLIINVIERPTIGQLKITGNSVIPTDKLTSVMTSLDVAEGRVYNPAMLEKIKQGLLNQYYQLGRYNAFVDVQVTRMPRHRVLVKITISEGLVAKIRRITILGNHVYSEKVLLKELPINTTGLLTFLTQTDRYTETRLGESVEKLRNYYLNHGYIHFEVKSSQAEVTPDRKAVFVTFVVEEGQPYTISNYDFEGDLIFTRAEYVKRIKLKPGDIFSRAKLIETQKAFSQLLGEKGYLYSSISLRPKVDESSHQVFLVFDVKPGKRTYVRQVTFSENTRTNDVVLRREVEQMEAAPASTLRLDESKHKLSLLPYIKNIDMSLKPVPGTDDQVDVNYKVKEDSSAQASFKVGYSQAYGVILGAGLNQKNFLGSGNTLGINLSRSQYEQLYGIDYTNPYYTEEGVSRSFNFSISRTDPSAVAQLNSGYATNEINLGVLYGVPIGQEVGVYNRIFAGVSYQNILVTLNHDLAQVSRQLNSFINRHGRRFQELDMKIGYSRDSRDRAIFPTRGIQHTLFLDAYAPLSHSSLAFYTLNYSGRWYQPITDQFIILTRGDFGYGNAWNGERNYPFFKNFYAGGINSVRGYSDFTLGPRDSKGDAYGGNMLVDASIGLIFPNYVSDNLRTIAFFDAGNVYSSLNNRSFGLKSTNSGPLRLSVGVEVDWMTMFAPIQLSLAKPINPKMRNKKDPLSVSDDTSIFQFALSANF